MNFAIWDPFSLFFATSGRDIAMEMGIFNNKYNDYHPDWLTPTNTLSPPNITTEWTNWD